MNRMKERMVELVTQVKREEKENKMTDLKEFYDS